MSLGEDFGFLATKEDIENELNEFSFSTKYKTKNYPSGIRVIVSSFLLHAYYIFEVVSRQTPIVLGKNT